LEGGVFRGLCIAESNEGSIIEGIHG
jgi:hypothetical protein